MSSDQYHKPAHFEHSVKVGYEETDANVPFIAWAGVAVVVFLVITVFAVQTYFDGIYNDEYARKVAEPVGEDIRNLRAREDSELYSYKYLDREAGTVRLPIQRAMELLVSESEAGKPFYPTTPQRIKESYPLVADPSTMGGVNDPASQALLAAAP
jgi:hypothetical protein